MPDILRKAIKGGNVKLLEQLLKNGCDPNKLNSALFISASQRSLKPAIIKLLVKHGADVNTQDRDGKTPLHIAAECCCGSVVEYLIEHGTDVNAKDKSGRTPLHHASVNPTVAYEPTVSDYDYYERQVFFIIRHLLEHGADINLKDEDGKTPLHIASLNDLEEIVNHYFENGDSDRPNMISVYKAAKFGTDMVKYLVEHGADVNAKDKYGKTVLHIKPEYRFGGMTQYFVEHGADLNIKDEDGMTPLHIALYNCTEDIVKYFVEHGADVNAKDKNGLTPLHIASKSRSDNRMIYIVSQRGVEDMVKYLIEHGADVNGKDEVGRDALEITSLQTKVSMIEIRQTITKLKNNTTTAF